MFVSVAFDCDIPIIGRSLYGTTSMYLCIYKYMGDYCWRKVSDKHLRNVQTYHVLHFVMIVFNMSSTSILFCWSSIITILYKKSQSNHETVIESYHVFYDYLRQRNQPLRWI